MEFALQATSWVFLAIGCFGLITSGLGLLRFPDFYSRIHASGVGDTLGAGFVLIGLILQSLSTGNWLNGVKLFVILNFMWLTGATAGHALAKSAWTSGLRPWTKGGDSSKR